MDFIAICKATDSLISPRIDVLKNPFTLSALTISSAGKFGKTVFKISKMLKPGCDFLSTVIGFSIVGVRDDPSKVDKALGHGHFLETDEFKACVKADVICCDGCRNTDAPTRKYGCE